MGWGDYPIEYNRNIHGPYDPSKYYGKADTPFGEVKIGELSKWFGRRNKTPRGLVGAMSRFYWRWNDKYVLPKKGGIAPICHLCFGLMAFYYVINYGNITKHRNTKYRW